MTHSVTKGGKMKCIVCGGDKIGAPLPVLYDPNWEMRQCGDCGAVNHYDLSVATKEQG